MSRPEIVRCTKGCGAKISATSKNPKVQYSISVKIYNGQAFFARILSGSRIELYPIKNSGITDVELDSRKIGSLELGSWNNITENSVMKQFELGKLFNGLRSRLNNNEMSDLSEFDVCVTVTGSCFKKCFEVIE